MKNLLKNKNTRTDLIAYLLVIVAFVVMQGMNLGGMLSSSWKGFLVPICVYISLAVSLNLLVGICGELSLGHAGFMGIGAFTGIVVAAVLQDVVPGGALRLFIAMLVGGVLAGGTGFLIGIPVLRLRGDYLAIVTLAFGEILKNIIGNLYVGLDAEGVHVSVTSAKFTLLEGGKMILDGPVGATGIKKLATFPMGFLLVLITLFVVLNLVNSKEGRAIKAVRDNRIAAESVGINVTAFRMKAFVVSAFLAGMAGALVGLNMGSLQASKFDYNTSIDILVYVVLGGMGNILGSIISTIVLYLIPELLRGMDKFRMILYAVVLIVVMLCTWSPKVKSALQVAKEAIKTKLASVLKKKEAGQNG